MLLLVPGDWVKWSVSNGVEEVVLDGSMVES
jgi:hypothetical protein